MPQISSYKVSVEGSAFSDALQKLSQAIEEEICTAILAENNKLAERLTKIRADLNRCGDRRFHEI